ncbi:MAG: hypothetical protein J6M18_05065 [Actinomycetaceae bacterium]|nr:hypothetical protein [Actinomycetaceae bacterium]
MELEKYSLGDMYYGEGSHERERESKAARVKRAFIRICAGICATVISLGGLVTFASAEDKTGYGDIFFGYVEPGTFEIRNSVTGRVVKTVQVLQAGPTWFTQGQELPVGKYDIYIKEAPGGYIGADTRPAVTVEVIDTEGRLPSGYGAFSQYKMHYAGREYVSWPYLLKKYKGVPNIRYGSVGPYLEYAKELDACSLEWDVETLRDEWEFDYKNFEENNWEYNGIISSPEEMNERWNLTLDYIHKKQITNTYALSIAQEMSRLFDTYKAGLTSHHFSTDEVLSDLLAQYNIAYYDQLVVEDKLFDQDMITLYEELTAENLYGMFNMTSETGATINRFDPIGISTRFTYRSTESVTAYDAMFNGFHYGVPSQKFIFSSCGDETEDEEEYFLRKGASVVADLYEGAQEEVTVESIYGFFRSFYDGDDFTGFDKEEFLSSVDWTVAFWKAVDTTNIYLLDFASFFQDEYGHVDEAELYEQIHAATFAVDSYYGSFQDPLGFFRDMNGDEIITIDDFTTQEMLEKWFGVLHVATAEIKATKEFINSDLQEGQFTFGLYAYDENAQTQENIATTLFTTSANEANGDVTFKIATAKHEERQMIMIATYQYSMEVLSFQPVSWWVDGEGGNPGYWVTDAAGNTDLSYDQYNYGHWEYSPYGLAEYELEGRMHDADFWECHRSETISTCHALHDVQEGVTWGPLQYTIAEVKGNENDILYDKGLAYADVQHVTPYGVSENVEPAIAQRTSSAFLEDGTLDETGEQIQEATFRNYKIEKSFDEDVPPPTGVIVSSPVDGKVLAMVALVAFAIIVFMWLKRLILRK